MDNNTVITTYNTAVTDAPGEILGKERHRKKLNLCGERRYLKKKRYEVEGAQQQQGSKQEASEGSEESKGGLDRWTMPGDSNLAEQKQQQESISAGEGSNPEKQGRSLTSTIKDRSGKFLIEEQEILSRWTEYWSELYNHESCGDNAVPDYS